MGLPYSIDFLKAMDEGVLVVNRDRQIILWNESATRISGYSERDMLGKTCSKQVKCHVNDEGEPLCEDQCPLRISLLSGKPCELAAKMRSKKGELLDVNIKVLPYHNAQGFIEGAIELFTTVARQDWHKEEAILEDRITYTDIETGMLNRNFLDSYYISLLKQEVQGFDRGLILIDVLMLEEIGQLKSRLKAFDIRHKIGDLLMAFIQNDTEMVAARWSHNSFVLLINNSHPVHLQNLVINLENRIRQDLYNQDLASIDLCFKLMSTLISADEPLEKVVDILHKRSAKIFRPKEETNLTPASNW